MNRLARILVTASLLVAVAAPASAVAAPTSAAAGTALDTFRAGHTKVVELVAKRADAAAIQKEVDGLLDYHALAEESLGGASRYAERCGTRCAEFEGLLARLIRENYLRRIRSDKEHSVQFLGEEARARGTKVRTVINYQKEGKDAVVEVDYVMHESDGRWQVRDIVTDGVSLAKNYKYEFNQILKTDGIDGLIGRLESKLAVLAKKD
ncbi:MAG: ABC transporter substrate-binding protein [Nannocystaceae bacterium]